MPKKAPKMDRQSLIVFETKAFRFYRHRFFSFHRHFIKVSRKRLWGWRWGTPDIRAQPNTWAEPERSTTRCKQLSRIQESGKTAMVPRGKRRTACVFRTPPQAENCAKKGRSSLCSEKEQRRQRSDSQKTLSQNHFQNRKWEQTQKNEEVEFSCCSLNLPAQHANHNSVKLHFMLQTLRKWFLCKGFCEGFLLKCFLILCS